MKRFLKPIIIIVFYLLLWALLSALTSTWLFPGPVNTLMALYRLLITPATYLSLLLTISRILAGFITALFLSLLMCLLAVYKGFFRELFYPFVLLAKSVPVACLTILCIIWFGAQSMSYAVVLLVALPIMYTQLLAAIDHVDNKRELVIIYDFSRTDRLRAVYLPQIRGVMAACIKLTIGMSFKAGIAAEVIGIVRNSIGEELYTAKLYFDTDRLFAWIILIMLVSLITEKLTGYIYEKLMDMLCSCPDNRKTAAYTAVPLIAEGISKSYDEKQILEDFNLRIDEAGLYAFCKPSGWGKSTALDIIAGLTTFDSGRLEADKVSYAFQEVRLIEDYTAVENISLALKVSRDRSSELLDGYLSSELKNRPVSKLSGGERRRVELARALNSDRNLILLDEPFSGLDDENIDFVCQAIRKASQTKKIIISLHEREEAVRINCNIKLL